MRKGLFCLLAALLLLPLFSVAAAELGLFWAAPVLALI